MSLAGDLSEYSLAEIFNFVQEGNKTGVLSIEPTCEAIDRSLCSSYDLVFQGGRVMSVATGNRSDRQSLLQDNRAKTVADSDPICRASNSSTFAQTTPGQPSQIVKSD